MLVQIGYRVLHVEYLYIPTKIRLYVNNLALSLTFSAQNAYLQNVPDFTCELTLTQ